MLAGASGVDLALLVVAADDSVMPQTREHLAVLELLGVRHGLIALTKVRPGRRRTIGIGPSGSRRADRADVSGRAPVIATSTRTGLGTAELKQAFVTTRHSNCRPERRTIPRFRLPIDRVFSPSGQGTVVTGTVWRGTARVGDTSAFASRSNSVRVRRLQSQGVDVEIGLGRPTCGHQPGGNQGVGHPPGKRAGHAAGLRAGPPPHGPSAVPARCGPWPEASGSCPDPSRGRPGHGPGAHAATRNLAGRRSICQSCGAPRRSSPIMGSRSSCGSFRRLGPSAAERSSRRPCVPSTG